MGLSSIRLVVCWATVCVCACVCVGVCVCMSLTLGRPTDSIALSHWTVLSVCLKWRPVRWRQTDVLDPGTHPHTHTIISKVTLASRGQLSSLLQCGSNRCGGENI